MNITFLSKSRFGKWSAGLSIAFLVLTLVQLSEVMRLPGTLIALMGLLGFILGILAIIKYKDRALLTYLSIPVGLLVIIFALAGFINQQ